MARNIEIKARIGDVAGVHAAAARLSGAPGEVIEQEDIFFHATRGRLKLRILAPDRGQVIFYERDDRTGPKSSDYVIAETSQPDATRAALTAALGVRGVVRKRRLLYRVGATRIHVDEVEGLGSFVELEVVLRQGETAGEGQAVAGDLMRALGIAREDLIAGAYIDLLEGR